MGTPGPGGRPGAARAEERAAHEGTGPASRLVTVAVVVFLVAGSALLLRSFAGPATYAWGLRHHHDVTCTVGSASLVEESLSEGGTASFVRVETVDCGVLDLPRANEPGVTLDDVAARVRAGAGGACRFQVADVQLPGGPRTVIRFLGFP